MLNFPQIVKASTTWNKGKLIGQKPPLKLREIWAIRIRLQLKKETRELAIFNLAIDSKLRSCDLVKLKIRDVCHGNGIAPRAMILQQKTQQPVQFEITEQTEKRIISYEMIDDNLDINSHNLEDVTEYIIVENGDLLNDTIVEVNDKKGNSFQLLLSTENNGDEKFIEALSNRIPSSKTKEKPEQASAIH